MPQIKKKSTAEAHYGMMSRWTDLMQLNTNEYAPEWVAHVFDRSMTILQHHHPKLLKEISNIIKKEFNG